MTNANSPNAYGWLPSPLATPNVEHDSSGGVGSHLLLPTLEMDLFAAGITSGDLNHACCYHTVFSGPPGFSGLRVLAYHDHNGNGIYDGPAIRDAGEPFHDGNIIIAGDDAIIMGGAPVFFKAT